jgi:hypothetical protein
MKRVLRFENTGLVTKSELKKVTYVQILEITYQTYLLQI